MMIDAVVKLNIGILTLKVASVYQRVTSVCVCVCVCVRACVRACVCVRLLLCV